jgi:protein phosphatase
MGGHAAGEVASSVTIASMAELDSEPPGDDILAELAAAVSAANTRLQEMIIANPAIEGMGTTLTALFWSDGHAAVCHIGDSRGYLLRENELYQITHDHTLVQSLVDEGRISAADVSTHPQRSLLLRALDGRSVAEPDLSVHEAQAGDRYLLCSDGLSGVVSDETLRETLATIAEPEAVTRQLIEFALIGGGPDNITCIVADVTDTNTTRLPPTRTPVLAGAAASVGDPLAVDGTNPFDAIDDHFEDRFGQPPLTASQPAMGFAETDPGSVPLALANGNGTGPNAVAGRRSHRAQPKRAARSGRGGRGRRRWPIVTTSLVVLLVVIIGGGYLGWLWSQDQYYVGTDTKGEVLIYRGVNERIAGVSLSKPYEQTQIMLDQVPMQYQQTLKSTDTASSLSDARNIVGTVSSAVRSCRQQYTVLQSWVTQENAYQAAVAAAKKQKKPTDKISKPGPQPARAASTCPPSTAFGIAASAIVPSATAPGAS